MELMWRPAAESCAFTSAEQRRAWRPRISALQDPGMELSVAPAANCAGILACSADAVAPAAESALGRILA
ncbi:hypothetical protein CYMTET_35473, partial [Cymbomonas tetramitiformis]